MAHVRLLGSETAVRRIADILSDAARTTVAAGPYPLRSGAGIGVSLLVADADIDCTHPTATVADERPVLGAGHRVEYGYCTGCGARVLRVAAYRAGELAGVSRWATLETAHTERSAAP